ncbi:hypothetical protein [Mycolicibacterium vinylchloridicum]|uniref:hypothetical protein n=1 Tax=Mycolicibacterium vinylchloridicum TaxID=2736928 RepID=UPI0015C944B0|nr:hypothetical protein [Mycolicibacterium vinylchloridicum]
MNIWIRIPSGIRALLLIAAWLTYGALLSNLNSLDDGSRTAEIIWGACLVGATVTVIGDSVRCPLLDTALRTGNLPDEIELADWRRRLIRSRVGAALTPWFATAYLGFGALSADSSRSPHRVLLLWVFGLGIIWVFVAVHKRTTRIRQLELAIRQRREAATPAKPTVPAEERRWRSNAETPMAGRITMTAVVGTAMAFVVLLVADLDSVVYSDSRAAHLGWATVIATVTGIAMTALAFGDPRLRANADTIDAILQYDWAFRAAELPAQFDVDQWRNWIRRHHQSDGRLLIWATFFSIVAGWAILTHPPGYHWIVAMLLAVLAIWELRRWQYLCAMNARLKNLVERHAIGQLFG